jgi:hypothetical protein
MKACLRVRTWNGRLHSSLHSWHCGRRMRAECAGYLKVISDVAVWRNHGLRRSDNNEDTIKNNRRSGDGDDIYDTNNNVFVASVVATLRGGGVDDPGFECRQWQVILNNSFSINHALKFKYPPQEDKGETRINVSHASLNDGDTFCKMSR